MSITAIIQARLNSTRLPKKVLLPFGRHTVLFETWLQTSAAKYVDKTVISYPHTDVELTEYLGYQVPPLYIHDYWGDEEDLIGRYYEAACESHADPIVRITSDCPLILPEVIDLVIKAHFRERVPFTFNRCDDLDGGWPDGLDVEVVDFDVLQAAYVLADKREDFQWIRDRFENYQVPCEKDYGPCMSIDTKEDYINALEILKNR